MKKKILCCVLVYVIFITGISACIPFSANKDLSYEGPLSYQYTRNINPDYLDSYDYENSDVVKHHEAFGLSYFDKTTNSVVTSSRYWYGSIYVYDADTMEPKCTLSTATQFRYNANYDAGYTYGSGVLLELYRDWSLGDDMYTIGTKSLETGEVTATATVSESNSLSDPVGICGDIYIYKPFWGGAKFVNLKTAESYQSEDYSGDISDDSFLVNQSENTLYVVETIYEPSSRILNFVDISNGKVTKSIQAPYSSYERNDLKLIGNGLRFCDKLYNPVSGELISDEPLIKEYNHLLGFTPQETLFSDNKYDIVAGYSDYKKEVALYDNALGKYVYLTAGTFNYVESTDNGKYYLIAYDRFSILDTTKISGVLEENLDDGLKLVEEGNTQKLYFSQKYTDIALDGEMLYIAFDNNIRVYDSKTFTAVKTLEFSHKVSCLDALNGTLVVGFGKEDYLLAEENAFFAIVKADDWTVNYIETQKGVVNISLYSGFVYFSGHNYWDKISFYDIGKDNITEMDWSFSQPYFTVDKKTGVLYVVETGISSSEITYFNLKKNNIRIYESDSYTYGYNNYRVILGGNYINYYGYLLHPSTGKHLKETVKRFPHRNDYNFLGTIYSDKYLTFSIEEKDGIKSVLACNVSNKKTIEFSGDAERVIKHNNSYFIVRPQRDTLFCITSK